MCSSLPLIGKGEGVRGGGPEKTPRQRGGSGPLCEFRDGKFNSVTVNSVTVNFVWGSRDYSRLWFRGQDALNLGCDVGRANDVRDYCDRVRAGA